MSIAHWTALSDSVWSRRYDFADETVGVVAGRDGCVVIDTLATPRDARRLRQDVADLTDRPIRAAVNTHGHWDHAFGNSVFADQPLWGHSNSAAFLARTAGPMLQRLQLMYDSPDDLAALAEVEVVPPTHLVDDQVTLDLGNRTVVLAQVGRAHTDTDLVIWVPDARVAFVGDLVKSNGPPGYRDAFPLEWPDAARRLIGLPVDVFVPGHGDPIGRDAVGVWVRTLAHTAELVREVAGGTMDADVASTRSVIDPRALTQAIKRMMSVA